MSRSRLLFRAGSSTKVSNFIPNFQLFTAERKYFSEELYLFAESSVLYGGVLMILDEPGGGILGNDATALQQTDQHEFGSLKYDERVFDLELQEAALAAYEQAIQLAPRAAILHYHKGQVLKQLGRHAEAQQADAEARSLGYYGQS